MVDTSRAFALLVAHAAKKSDLQLACQAHALHSLPAHRPKRKGHWWLSGTRLVTSKQKTAPRGTNGPAWLADTRAGAVTTLSRLAGCGALLGRGGARGPKFSFQAQKICFCLDPALLGCRLRRHQGQSGEVRRVLGWPRNCHGVWQGVTCEKKRGEAVKQKELATTGGGKRPPRNSSLLRVPTLMDTAGGAGKCESSGEHHAHPTPHPHAHSSLRDPHHISVAERGTSCIRKAKARHRHKHRAPPLHRWRTGLQDPTCLTVIEVRPVQHSLAVSIKLRHRSCGHTQPSKRPRLPPLLCYTP